MKVTGSVLASHRMTSGQTSKYYVIKVVTTPTDIERSYYDSLERFFFALLQYEKKMISQYWVMSYEWGLCMPVTWRVRGRHRSARARRALVEERMRAHCAL